METIFVPCPPDVKQELTEVVGFVFEPGRLVCEPDGFVFEPHRTLSVAPRRRRMSSVFA